MVDRFAVAKPSLPCEMRGRLRELLSSRRLGRDRHRPIGVAGGGVADIMGHGIEREALGASDDAKSFKEAT